MFLQCHAVYTAATLQHTGCAYTADTLQIAVYTVSTLYIHCIYTAVTGIQEWIQLPEQWWTGSTLNIHCYYTVDTLHAHCHLLAVYLKPILCVHCSYTETILPVHSTSVWACTTFGCEIQTNSSNCTPRVKIARRTLYFD